MGKKLKMTIAAALYDVCLQPGLVPQTARTASRVNSGDRSNMRASMRASAAVAVGSPPPALNHRPASRHSQRRSTDLRSEASSSVRARRLARGRRQVEGDDGLEAMLRERERIVRPAAPGDERAHAVARGVVSPLELGGERPRHSGDVEARAFGESSVLRPQLLPVRAGACVRAARG